MLCLSRWQVNLAPGAKFSEAAEQQVQKVLQAVQDTTETMLLDARVRSTTAIAGCVHVLLDVVLLRRGSGAEASAAAAPSAVLQQEEWAQLAQHLAAALQAQAPVQDEPVAQVMVAAVPAVPGPVPSSTPWTRLPWSCLPSPVCLQGRRDQAQQAAAAAAADDDDDDDDSQHLAQLAQQHDWQQAGQQHQQQRQAPAPDIRLALLPGFHEELPARPLVVLTGLQLGAGSALRSMCHVAADEQLWLPAASEGARRLLGVSSLPAGPAPAVLTLQLLPKVPGAAAAAPVAPEPEGLAPQPAPKQATPHQAEPQAASANPAVTGAAEAATSLAAGGGASMVHPLASLPLLQLPPAACAEVLAMFAAMVRQLMAAATSPAASHEPAAQRQVYWRYFVPFVCSWRTLLLLLLTDAARSQRPATGIHITGATLAAAPAAHSQDRAQLRSEAQLLCSYLRKRGMHACLSLAQELLQAAGGSRSEAGDTNSGTSQQQASARQGSSGTAVFRDAACTMSHGGQHPETHAMPAPIAQGSAGAAASSSNRAASYRPAAGSSSAGLAATSAVVPPAHVPSSAAGAAPPPWQGFAARLP
jgi:hypothetical protein